jgi:hypothetical protein
MVSKMMTASRIPVAVSRSCRNRAAEASGSRQDLDRDRRQVNR